MTENRTGPVETLDHQLAAEMPRLKAFLQKLAPQEWEDLVQEVAARALRYRSAFSPEGSLRGWLRKTAFHVFVDHRRRSSRSPVLLGDQIVELEAPAGSDRENREIVTTLLHGLSENERDVLIRFHCNEESIVEIARRLDRPEGTVKSLLHRARRKVANSGRKAPL